MGIVWISFYIFLIVIFLSTYFSNKSKENLENKIEEYNEELEEYNEDLEEYNNVLEETEEKNNEFRNTKNNYNKLTKKELLELIEQQNKKLEELEKKQNKKQNTKTTNNSTISFKIINFYLKKDRIELLWTNKSNKNVHFIVGTLKFYDKNNNLLGVDSKHICSDLNAYTEKAEIIEYLKIPYGTDKVNISISNIYYY